MVFRGDCHSTQCSIATNVYPRSCLQAAVTVLECELSSSWCLLGAKDMQLTLWLKRLSMDCSHLGDVAEKARKNAQQSGHVNGGSKRANPQTEIQGAARALISCWLLPLTTSPSRPHHPLSISPFWARKHSSASTIRTSASHRSSLSADFYQLAVGHPSKRNDGIFWSLLLNSAHLAIRCASLIRDTPDDTAITILFAASYQDGHAQSNFFADSACEQVVRAAGRRLALHRWSQQVCQRLQIQRHHW